MDIKNQENFDKFEYPLWGDNYKGLKTTISNEQFKKPGILILEMERHGRCIIESSNVWYIINRRWIYTILGTQKRTEI